jgi:hypothetical protein
VGYELIEGKKEGGVGEGRRVAGRAQGEEEKAWAMGSAVLWTSRRANGGQAVGTSCPHEY